MARGTRVGDVVRRVMRGGEGRGCFGRSGGGEGGVARERARGEACGDPLRRRCRGMWRGVLLGGLWVGGPRGVAGGSIETGDMAVGRSHAAIYAGVGDFGVWVRASLSFAVGGVS